MTTARSAEELRAAVGSAMELYVADADLRRACGESGRIYASVEIHLEHGKVRWTKGAVYFERRIGDS